MDMCDITRKKRKWYDPTFLKFSSSDDRERRYVRVRVSVCVKYQCLLASFEYEINLFFSVRVSDVLQQKVE